MVETISYVNINIEQSALFKLISTDLIRLNEEGGYEYVVQRLGWFDDWYEMWPRKIKSGGYLIRSDKNSCATKMVKFRKANPQFTPDIILEATTNYVNTFKRRDWAFIQKADYFINKDNSSTLYSYCDEVIDNMCRPVTLAEEEFTRQI